MWELHWDIPINERPEDIPWTDEEWQYRVKKLIEEDDRRYYSKEAIYGRWVTDNACRRAIEREDRERQVANGDPSILPQ